jgi:hypothetical protein
MPDGLIPNEGLNRFLKWMLDNGDTALTFWRMGLYVNDLTPVPGTVLADLVEPSWSSYSRIALPNGDWSAPTLDGDSSTSTNGVDPIEFKNVSSAAETPYGLFIVDPIFGVLKWVQRFDPGDIRSIGAGASVLIVPRFGLRGTCP